jgi:hypothetical protein
VVDNSVVDHWVEGHCKDTGHRVRMVAYGSASLKGFGTIL